MIPGVSQQSAATEVRPVTLGADWETRKERMLARIRSSTDLPTLPIIALRVIEKASNPECDPEELSHLVGQDPALCAKILRTVNSVMFGLRQPVSSLQAAVRVLGIDPLRSLVLSLSLSRVRQPPLARDILQSYWRVSVAGGLAAWRLAIRGQRPSPDTDLIAGLLRDLGMLVLYQLCPKEYQTILGVSPAILSGFQCELEDEALQVTHAEASAELLRLWRLPEEVTEPVRYHHDWARAGELPESFRPRAQLLYFATQIGQLQLTVDRPMLVHEVLTLASAHFGMAEEELRALLQWVQNQMEEFASLLEVDLGQVLDYSEVLNRGVEELTRLTVLGSRAVAPPLEPGTVIVERAPGVDPQPNLPAPPKTGSSSSLSWSRKSSPAFQGRLSAEVKTFLEIQKRVFQKAQRPGTLGILGSYDILEVIGSGGMGTVFRALDTQLKRTVAIKTLLPHLVDNRGALDRFMQEGCAVAALTHENIVRVYAVGESNGVPYLVMEYIQGRTLTDRLLAEAPMPLEEIIRIGLQTASGLSMAHAHGLVHRDIKPANLLLENDSGRVKIVDFGLAQVIAEVSPTRGQTVEGSPHFMSPEQAQAKPTDARSDMFSLGCVLYTACTAQLPFDGENVSEVMQAICECQPIPIRSLNPDLPTWLEEVLIGLLTRQPARRFPTAAEMKRLFLSRWASFYTGSKKK
jgi:HD-like signal output (HDOD) protein